MEGDLALLLMMMVVLYGASSASFFHEGENAPNVIVITRLLNLLILGQQW